MPEAVVRVLFVCMGNICRSPTAEGVFRSLVAEQGLADRIATDSAGTIRYHQGNPPDERAQSAAAERGIDIGDLRARQVEPRDYHEFDYLIINDDFDIALTQMKDILHGRGSKLSLDAQRERLKDLVQELIPS